MKVKKKLLKFLSMKELNKIVGGAFANADTIGKEPPQLANADTISKEPPQLANADTIGKEPPR